ncbi:MAG: sodium:solute symporter [Bacteroidia bacterium]|nr:sodium:solute symporter [Bacteroidia bacterium]
MNPYATLLILASYFAALFLIAWLTGRKADNAGFFKANQSAPWYIVAFGLIGTSISGVTFISVPGKVGYDHWAYMQMVFGYLIGYLVIGTVLMPLYYRMGLTSIYTYLEKRFGTYTYKTGAVFFLISRLIGSSLRMYLVAMVLQLALFEPLGIPFWVNVLVSLGLIFAYTFKGGVKTVIWTDTLQTAAFLGAAAAVLVIIGQELGLNGGSLVAAVRGSELSSIWVWDWKPGNSFFKQFIGGAFIAIAMSGLDQDIMQKNLACRNIREAQQNMLLFSCVLVFVNLLFVSLGTMLYLYGQETGLVAILQQKGCMIQIADPVTHEMVCRARTDELFPLLALNYLGPVVGICFLIGIVAAAYSSADSALTSLTTSYCVDMLDFEKQAETSHQQAVRIRVHLVFAGLMAGIILFFGWINNQAVIDVIFDVATYTYGPLLGMFFYGLLTRRAVRDTWTPWICLLAPALTYLIQLYSPQWLGYTFSFEKLPLNGLLTMAGLALAGWGLPRVSAALASGRSA